MGWEDKYRRHTYAAEQRGMDTSLTFDQYMTKVREAGIENPDQIGKRAGQFQLGRVGDVGRYEDANCRFITARQNRQECFQNGRHLEGMKRLSELRTGQTKDVSEWARKISQTLTGRTKETDPGLAAMAEKLRGRTASTDPSLASAADKKSRDFVLVSPDGQIHEGRNISEFCRSQGLSQGKMSDVCRGDRRQHKGWTGHYLPDEPDFVCYFHDD
jgi:hypothetical protein